MLLVVSLDSVAEPLVRRLADEGRLPNLAALRRRGWNRELREELPGAVYATLFTGMRLADHGVHFPIEWAPERQVAVPSSSRHGAELSRASVFRRLAAAGRKVLVLDPPECAPYDVPGGVVASGIEFRARILLPRWERPAGIQELLRTGAPRIEEVFGAQSDTHLVLAARGLMDAPARLPAAWGRLATQGPFDLVWLTFAAAHQAGHMLYDDTTWAPSFSAAARRELTGSLARVYERVDAALGEALARLPPGAAVLVLSAKGMGPNAARVDLLGAMIDRVLGQGAGVNVGPSPLWWLRQCVPASWRDRGASLLPDHAACAITGRLETLGKDWRKTRAFAVPCDTQGFIRLNVAGRERKGILPPADAPAVVEELCAGLASFTDVAGETDGQSAIATITPSRVWCGDGRAVDGLPDLVVHWAPGRANLIAGVRSERFGEITRRRAGTGRAGNHCVGSVVTLLADEAWRGAAETPGRLEDVAPTVCDLLGVPASDLPGTPLFVRGD